MLVSVGTVRLKLPLAAVSYDVTNVSFSLSNQLTFNLTESISVLETSSPSITWPTTVKSRPAVMLFGIESILISVVDLTTISNNVKLPVRRELPTAKGSVKSS